MRKFPSEVGGPEEDRTPDLFIAKVAATCNINDLRRCNNGVNSVKTGGECTDRAQSKPRLNRGSNCAASNGGVGL
jgi:hypothetical protein